MGTKIPGMNKAVAIVALSVAAMGIAAADELADVATSLEVGLVAQAEILATVTDAAGAAAAVEPLKQNLKSLAALNGRVPTTDLWNRIETQPELKKKLVDTIQQISISFCRIQEADYYGCSALKELLQPLLTPAADVPEEQGAQ